MNYVTRRPYPGDDTFCTGFDVPDRKAWGPADVAFWTGTPTYQPWKDVAAFGFTDDDALLRLVEPDEQ